MKSVLCAMKSALCSDEICFADEIKSALLPTESDLVKKKTTPVYRTKVVSFLVRVMGLEEKNIPFSTLKTH